MRNTGIDPRLWLAGASGAADLITGAMAAASGAQQRKIQANQRRKIGNMHLDNLSQRAVDRTENASKMSELSDAIAEQTKANKNVAATKGFTQEQILDQRSAINDKASDEYAKMARTDGSRRLDETNAYLNEDNNFNREHQQLLRNQADAFEKAANNAANNIKGAVNGVATSAEKGIKWNRQTMTFMTPEQMKKWREEQGLPPEETETSTTSTVTSNQ